jgi:hypothetical protein
MKVAMNTALKTRSIEWVRCVADYRTLEAKRNALGCGLDPVELRRLEELELFFVSSADQSERGPFGGREQVRMPVCLGVTFHAPGRQEFVGRGELRDLSAVGLYLRTRDLLPVGTRLILRATDEARGEDWRLGAEVVRRTRNGMGLKLVGIPVTLRVGHKAQLLARAA